MKRILLSLGLLLSLASPALASPDDPVLGGCIIWEQVQPPECRMDLPGHPGCICKLSAHPAVIQPLSAIDLKTGTLLYGIQAVTPGFCYGVTYGPSRWYASGANFCLNVAHVEMGNLVFPSGVLQLLKWGVVGFGGMCSDAFSSDNKSLTCHAMLLFGANLPIE